MKFNKLTEQNLNDITKMLKALSDRTRLLIMQTLHHGEKSVTEIVEVTKSSQANISKHLKILADAQLVKSHKEGTTVFYSISDPCVDNICNTICSGYTKLMKKKYKALNL